MAPLLSYLPRLRGFLIKTMIVLIRRKFALTPVHVLEGDTWIPLYVRGVNFSVDPDGVRFSLRCYLTKGTTFAPTHLDPSSSKPPHVRVWILDYQKIDNLDGKWCSISPTAPPAA